MVNGMNSWFSIMLDTTPPVVTIHTPRYVMNGHYFEFRISVNEKVDPGRFEAKAVDNSGNEYPIILQYIDENNEFVGLVDTFGFVDGMAEVIVTIYDETHNSTTTVQAFKILNNNIHSIEINMMSFDNTISYRSLDNKITNKYRINAISSTVMKSKVLIIKRKNTINFKVGE